MLLGQIFRLFMRFLLLRAKPEAVPYSVTLFTVLLFAVGAIKMLANLWFVNVVDVYSIKTNFELSFPHALLISAVHLLILVACVHTVLAIYNLSERTLQVCSAFLGVDLLFGLAQLLWIFGLSSLDLPLATGSAPAIILLLAFILLLYWQFMVYIHIIFNSMTLSVIQAWVFALVYMLLQINVGEILLSLLVRTSEQ